VLKANDLEIHLFAEYCREHLCEDAVIFLLETAMFGLLFDPSDLLTQGKRIYDTYLDPSSEERIVVAASTYKSVKELIDAASKPGQPGLTPKLFDKVVDEVTATLNLDVWPRYKETVLAGEDIRLSSIMNKGAAQKVDTDAFVDMSKPSKSAVRAALLDPERLELMREAAASQGVKEAVDFCVQCASYKLLFSEADRKPRAKVIHATYLQAGADYPVNVPDTMTKHVEKLMGKDDFNAPPELFEACHNEILQVLSDNIFLIFTRMRQEAEAKKAEEAEARRAAAEAAKKGGGCCVLM
jgi:hypothetical protein